MRISKKTLAWFFLTFCLAICLTVIFSHAFITDKVITTLCDNSDRYLPKGFPRPALIVGQGEADGIMWIRLAEEIDPKKSLRVRHTNIDNHPTGREVHWNSAYAWYLRILGEIYRALTNDSLLYSISRVSIWANTVILAISLVLLALFFKNNFGVATSSATVACFLLHPGIYEQFLPAYPDHHGLIAIFLMSMVSCLALSYLNHQNLPDNKVSSLENGARKKNLIILSGIFAGCSLWISAITTALFLVTLALGLFLAHILSLEELKKSPAPLDCSLYDTLATSALISSLFFYILEYFPNHITMRLETNHPLYSLSLYCGIRLFGRFLRSCLSDNVGNKPQNDIITAVLPVGLLILPATVIIFRDKVYLPLDSFFWGLTKGISELQALTYFARLDSSRLFWEVIMLPVSLVIGLVALFLNFGHVIKRVTILTLIICLILCFFLAFYQKRWLILPSVTSVALFCVSTAVLFSTNNKVIKLITFVKSIVILCLTMFATYKLHISSSWSQFRSLANLNVDYVQAVYLFHRDLGKYILAAGQNRDAVLLSSPNSSILSAGVGGFKTIGTHYWENTQGLKNTYKALASQTSQEAYQHMVNLGVTHIALLSWGGISEDLLELISKETDKRHVMQNTFYYRCLFAEELPLWVKPMPVPPHPYAEKLGIKFLLLEFAPEQKPEEAFFHAARYLFLSKRDKQAAIKLYKKALEIKPDFAEAQRELSFLQSESNESSDIKP